MSNLCKGGPENSTHDVSPSGWMEGDQFFRWFEKVFVPYVVKLDGYKILFFDGHASHISIKLIDLARDKKIILFIGRLW